MENSTSTFSVILNMTDSSPTVGNMDNFSTAISTTNLTTLDMPTAETTSVLAAVETYMWLIFSPIIFFVGIFGNILNITILIRLKFYKNSTLLLLFILAWTDMAVLIVGLPRYFFVYAIDFDLRLVSQFSCKLSLFLIYITMQMSSWILVLVTTIRFMKTVFPLGLRFKKMRGTINVRRSLITLCVIVVVLFSIDAHFFWTNGITTSDGDSVCSSLNNVYDHFDNYVFVYIDFVFLSVIPAVIMTVMNGFILHQMRKLDSSRKRRNSVSHNRGDHSEPIPKVTIMLMVTSTYFIAASVPISVYFIVDSYVRPGADSDTEYKLDLVWTITYLFQFSHFALNFYFYTATNARFRNSLKTLVKNIKKSILLKLYPEKAYELAERNRKPSRSVTISS